MNAAISAIARFGLVAVWLWSGTMKLLNPLDSRQAIAAYELLSGGMIGFVAVALPALELILGLMLLIGLFLRWAAAPRGGRASGSPCAPEAGSTDVDVSGNTAGQGA